MNPVVATQVATSIGKSEAAKQAASVIPFIIKTAIIGGIVWYVYNRYTNRFVPMKENAAYPPANITAAQAAGRADAIYQSVGWFSGDFETVQNSLANVNYNGFVRIYNAFGERPAKILSGDMNLIAWLNDVIHDRDKLMQLSALQNGAFF